MQDRVGRDRAAIRIDGKTWSKSAEAAVILQRFQWIFRFPMNFPFMRMINKQGNEA
jgi:hypothetical protein